MNFVDFYGEIQNSISMTQQPEFKELVSPKLHREYPFDRWFHYKEGYSSQLPIMLLNQFNSKPGEVILDPFLGSGSSLIAAHSLNMSGCGIELNPFSFGLTRLKLHAYSAREILDIKEAIKEVAGFLNMQHEVRAFEIPELSIIKKVFPDNLTEIMSLMEHVREVYEGIVRDFLMFGCGCILEKVGRARKDGNGLRYPRNKKTLPFRETLLSQYQLMISDIENEGVKNPFNIVAGDARSWSSYEKMNPVDYVIFSPPYANCFDYAEVYKVELWMMRLVNSYQQVKTLRQQSISSHLNKSYADSQSIIPEIQDLIDQIKDEELFASVKIKRMITHYFTDMDNVFANCYRVLKDGGKIAIVIGNSAYGKVPIATDLFFVRLLREKGFKVEEIRVARRLPTSVQQKQSMKDCAFLRESVVIARKA